MIAEFIELRYRIEKLEQRLQWSLPEKERDRLLDQLDIMRAYSGQLCDRMASCDFYALTFLYETEMKWKEHNHD